MKKKTKVEELEEELEEEQKAQEEKQEHTFTPKEGQKLQNQINQLQQQNLILQDLQQLKNENYFRQQLLLQLERIAQANERQAKAIEDSMENSEDNDEEDNNEEED